MYVLIILCYIFVLYSCKSNSVELLINMFLLLFSTRSVSMGVRSSRLRANVSVLDSGLANPALVRGALNHPNTGIDLQKTS